MAFERVLGVDQLGIGDICSVKLGTVPVLLVRLDDGVYAYEDRCQHQGASLATGYLSGKGVLTCSAHHWQYDARTGRGTNPESTQLGRYEARIHDSFIEVDLTRRIAEPRCLQP
jgi:toluene monooxygenase system ferredoxin subunit